MRLRTQLAATFLLLAVLPLAAIVLFSYVSSLRTVRRAVQRDAAEMTLEMERRMGGVRAELARRVERVGELPFGRLMSDAAESGEKRVLMGRALTELGDAARLVESLEFVPVTVPARAPLIEMAPPAPDVPVPEAAQALPPPPTPVFDLSEVLKEIEGELGDLSSEEREQLLEKARAGLDAARMVSETVRFIFSSADGEESRVEGETVIELEESDESPEISAQAASRSPRLVEVLHRRHVTVPVREDGRLVGEVKAELSVDQLLYGILAMTRREQGEVPFALDREGRLYVASEGDRARLEELPLGGGKGDGPHIEQVGENWIVVTSDDPETGLTFGIARPIDESLAEIRSNAVRNFAFGSALIGVALLVILPISGRMTRSLQLLTDGALRIAGGDLETRVPVKARNEIGQLAHTFNRMAGDLRTNQQQLVEETRRRHEQEVQQSLLQAEYDRKSEELEEARRFQLSLLPSELPRHPSFEVAVFMKTATEVGGDYYDFKLDADGRLTAAVGDATGHGARAGTMVTVIKSLFSAAPRNVRLGRFLEEAGGAIRRMQLGRMAMALLLVRLDHRRLTLSSAGMPPPLLHRRGAGSGADPGPGRVEEIGLRGMPLGGLAESYDEVELEVEPGDTLLLMSDGFPELPNREGDPIGYEKVHELFERAAGGTPQEVVTSLAKAAESWAGGEPPYDDVTFVVLQVR